MINDKKKYSSLIKTLKSLQQVKAPPNFESDLKRKLNEDKNVEKSKRSIKDFFIPSRLIPSFGLAAAAVVVFLLVNTSSEEPDNPLMIEPKVREDIISVEGNDLLKLPDGERSNVKDDANEKDIADKENNELKREGMSGDNLTETKIIAESESFMPESILTDRDEVATSDEYSSPAATGLAIRKSGLNFRQIKPTEAEQEEILKLKKKIQKHNKTKKVD